MKIYDASLITLDGRMDEPVWQELTEYGNFRRLGREGGAPSNEQTSFKILRCEDRIIFGVKCLEPFGMESARACKNCFSPYSTHSIQIFLSPDGTTFNYYLFCCAMDGRRDNLYYEESGNIMPDPYNPEWDFAVYEGEDYWSLEISIPLKALYMTSNDRWSDKWLINVARDWLMSPEGGTLYSTWSPLYTTFHDTKRFTALEGFPPRPLEDDVRMTSVKVDVKDEIAERYNGTLSLIARVAVAGEFIFTTSCSEPVRVNLKAGNNEIIVPCVLKELGRQEIAISLTRVGRGEEYKRYYSVFVEYIPIVLKFTLPEFRTNFYPGQDYSKVVGKVISSKDVTLKLEGPGIETQIVKPDADGNFIFETPNFEYGEAILTATGGDYEMQKKIRRLAPIDRTMTWISGGNLVINGRPTLRRNFYGHGKGGVFFNRRYDEVNTHETHICRQTRDRLEPRFLIPASELTENGEAKQDIMPSDEMFRLMDEMIERSRDYDFTHYYLSDEPDCRLLSPVYFRHLYEHIAEKDPYHVVLICTHECGKYLDCADWFEVDPYLVPFNAEDGNRYYVRPMNTLGDYAEELSKLNRPDKCVGVIPGCFATKELSLSLDYPDFDEYLCSVWAIMIRGCKSIWPYAYHYANDREALWAGSLYLFSTFEALEDLMLFAKRTVLVRTPEYEATRYDYNGQSMFVLINLTENPITVTLDGVDGQWYNFRHSSMITDNTFNLGRFEVVVGTSHVLDEGLPTYQEVTAIVDQKEYERTHTGSLLFERFGDIAVTVSGDPEEAYRLFDGTRTNLAMSLDGDRFCELDISKLKVTFNKVAVHGYGLQNIKLMFRNGGELTDALITDVQYEEFSATIQLADAVCPECVRIEFDKEEKLVELYEIEVF